MGHSSKRKRGDDQLLDHHEKKMKRKMKKRSYEDANHAGNSLEECEEERPEHEDPEMDVPTDYVDNSQIKTVKEKQKQNRIIVKTIVKHMRSRCTCEDLNNFILAVQAFNSSEIKEDVVFEYLRHTKNFQELIGQLKESETAPTVEIFKVLEQIFLRVASDLQNFENIAFNVVTNIMKDHSRVLYQVLGRKKASGPKAALSLLTSMVMLNTASARLILTSFSFTHPNVTALLKHTNIKDPQDVRTTYICFLLSFLISDYGGIPQSFLSEKKGVLNSVFYSMHSDKFTTIQLFLSTILNKIVLNPDVSKTAKIGLLNDFTLKHVLELYHWTGPVSWKVKKKRKYLLHSDARHHQQGPASDEETMVAELAHKFLLTVCGSSKHGILFNDTSCGTSGRNLNHNLTNILMAIKNPLESSYTEELVLNILSASPDQIHFYLPTLKDKFTPRPTSLWESSIEFLCKIYDKQTPVSVLIKAGKQPPQKLVTVVSVMLIPLVYTSEDITEAIKNESLRVRQGILYFLSKILRKAQDLINYVEENAESLPFLAESDIPVFINGLRSSILKILPYTESLADCWERVMEWKKSHLNIKQANNQNYDSDSGTFETTLFSHLQILTEVYLLLQHLIPSLNYRLDLSQIFAELQQMDDVKNSDALHAFKFRLIETIVHSEMSQGIFSNKSMCEMIIGYLLQVTISDSADQEALTAGNLLRKLLENNGFVDEQKEIVLWLFNLKDSPQRNKEARHDFLKSCILNMIENQSLFWNVMKECQAEEAHSFSDDTNFLEKFLLPGNKFQCTSSNATSSTYNVLTYTTYSMLVPSALKIQETGETCLKEENISYLVDVLTDILHVQEDPFPLCNLLNRHSSLFPKSFNRYLKSLRTVSNISTKIKNPEIVPDSLKASIQEYFTQRPLLKTQNDACYSQDLENISDPFILFQLTHQCRLYLKICLHEIKDFPSHLTMIRILCSLLLDIIKRHPNCLESYMNVKIQNVKIILECPDVLSFFFHEGVLDSEECWLTSKAITELVVNLTKTLKKHNSGRTAIESEPLLEPYCQKFLAVVRSSFEQSTPDLKINPKKLAVFANFLKFGDLCRLLEFADLDSIRKQPWLLEAFCTKLKESQSPNVKNVFPSHILQKWRSFSLDMKFITHHKELADCFPFYSVILDSDLFSKFLVFFRYSDVLDFVYGEKNISKEILIPQTSILKTMISYDISHWIYFHSWFMETLNQSSNVTDMLPLVEVYMRYSSCQFREDSLISGEIKVMMKKFSELYEKSLKSYLFSEKAFQPDSEVFNNNCSLLNSLILFDLINFKHVIKHLVKMQPLHRKQLLILGEGEMTQVIVNLLEVIKEPKKLCNLTYLCLEIIHQFCLDSDGTWGKISELIHSLILKIKAEEVLIEESLTIGDVTIDWMDYSKALLKTSLSNKDRSELLELMLTLCDKMNLKNDSWESLHEIICGHSNFLPVMLGEFPEFLHHKGFLIDIFQLLCTRNPAICKSHHIPFLLASYKATLSLLDQKILRLIFAYESNGVSTREFRPFVWGSAANVFYSVQKNIGYTLENEPRLEEVLHLFDSKKLLKTAFNFPLKMKLKPEVQELRSEKIPPDQIYDPRFFLPLLSYMIGPENFVKCKTVLESGALNVVFASLSSSDEDMRAVGYQILMSFFNHLEGSRYPLKFMLLHLLKALAQGIPTPNTKLPCVMSVFLMKAFNVLTSKDDDLYFVLVAFITLRPLLDIDHVPEFLKLFNSSDFKEFREHRNWMLSLLAHGLKEKADFIIYEKSYVFKIVLSYCVSSLCDDSEVMLILTMLESAAIIPSVANKLVMKKGLLSELHGILLKHCNEAVFMKICSILGTLWRVLIPKKGGTSGINIDERIIVEFSILIQLLLKQIRCNSAFQGLGKWMHLTGLMSSVFSLCVNASTQESITNPLLLLHSPAEVNDVYTLHQKVMTNNNIEVSSICSKLNDKAVYETLLPEEKSVVDIARQCYNNFTTVFVKWCNAWQKRVSPVKSFLLSSSENENNLTFSTKTIPSFSTDTCSLQIIFNIIEHILEYLCWFPEEVNTWTEFLALLSDLFRSFRTSETAMTEILQQSQQLELIFNRLLTFSPTLITLPTDLNALMHCRGEDRKNKILLLHLLNDIWICFLKQFCSFSIPSKVDGQSDKQRTPLLHNMFRLVRLDDYKELFEVAISYHDSVTFSELSSAESKVRAVNLFLCELLLGKETPSHFKQVLLHWNVQKVLAKLPK